jgi:hypothetical protein
MTAQHGDSGAARNRLVCDLARPLVADRTDRSDPTDLTFPDPALP